MMSAAGRVGGRVGDIAERACGGARECFPDAPQIGFDGAEGTYPSSSPSSGSPVAVRARYFIVRSLFAVRPEVERAPGREHVEPDRELVAGVFHSMGLVGL